MPVTHVGVTSHESLSHRLQWGPVGQFPPFRMITNSFPSSPDIVKFAGGKRKFEFNLSQTEGFHPFDFASQKTERSVVPISQSTDRLFYSSSDISRRSILDCLEGISHNHVLEISRDELPVEGNRFDCSNSEDLNHLSSLQPSRSRADQVRERSTNLVTNEVRIEGVPRGRPPLPGPASSGIDPSNSGHDKASQAVQQIQLPARIRHHCVSPGDPDFSTFSWRKMLQDLDLGPYSGFTDL